MEARQPVIVFSPLPAGLSVLSSLLFQESLPASILLDLSQLDTVKEEMLHRWLHQKEEEQLARYRFPKRHREYLGGRLCAKEGLSLFLQGLKTSPLPPPPSRCRVAAEESGRPYFHLQEDDQCDFAIPNLSISHSEDYGAALISNTPCGIDIQYHDPGLERVKERFCTET
ncbi:MAG: hypothetical protein ABFR63_10285, partial [Thermodesulfobacteriota bacterium]